MNARILETALRDIRQAEGIEGTDSDIAHQLAAALARRGWSLVPATLDDSMRLAIWLAQAEHIRLTRPHHADTGPEISEGVARARVEDALQRQQDQAAWDAALAEAARRLR